MADNSRQSTAVQQADYRNFSATDRVIEGTSMSKERTFSAEMRQALHSINNSLHVLGLQVELARLHLDNGNVHDARLALDQALRERNSCGDTSRHLQTLIRS